MKTKLYAIFNASLFLLLIAAAHSTLAQNHAGRLLRGASRLETRAAQTSAATGESKAILENASPDTDLHP